MRLIPDKFIHFLQTSITSNILEKKQNLCRKFSNVWWAYGGHYETISKTHAWNYILAFVEKEQSHVISFVRLKKIVFPFM